MSTTSEESTTKMEVQVVGRATAEFAVPKGITLSIMRRYSGHKADHELYEMTVKVEGPTGAPDQPIAGDSHAMLRFAVEQAAEALHRCLDEDEARTTARPQVRATFDA